MSQAVYIEVDGTRLPVWDSYSVDSDMLVPSDGFTFSVSLPSDSYFSESRRRAELREKLHAGAAVNLYVGEDTPNGPPSTRTLQMTGVIDDSVLDVTREGGTVIKLEGRDLASYLVDSSIALDIPISVNMPLLTLLENAVQPWGIEVVADSFAARETLRGNQRRRAGSRNRRAARSAGIRPDAYSLTAQAEAERTGRPLEDVVGADLEEDAGAIQARNAARGSFANSLTQSDIQRLRIRDARPKVGETVWAFCERHVKRLGLLMWMSPDGRLIVSSPDYTQEPSYSAVRRYRSQRTEPNNILSGGVRQSIGERFNEITVYGKGNPRITRRNARATNAARTEAALREGEPTDVNTRAVRATPIGTASDDGWPGDGLLKRHIMQDPSVRTDAQAEKRAIRELNILRRQAFVLEYTLADHAQGGTIYSVDTIVSVVDEAAAVNGNFYITRRSFSRDVKNGTSTSIKALPVGSLLL